MSRDGDDWSGTASTVISSEKTIEGEVTSHDEPHRDTHPTQTRAEASGGMTRSEASAFTFFRAQEEPAKSSWERAAEWAASVAAAAAQPPEYEPKLIPIPYELPEGYAKKYVWRTGRPIEEHEGPIVEEFHDDVEGDDNLNLSAFGSLATFKAIKASVEQLHTDQPALYRKLFLAMIDINHKDEKPLYRSDWKEILLSDLNSAAHFTQEELTFLMVHICQSGRFPKDFAHYLVCATHKTDSGHKLDSPFMLTKELPNTAPRPDLVASIRKQVKRDQHAQAVPAKEQAPVEEARTAISDFRL